MFRKVLVFFFFYDDDDSTTFLFRKTQELETTGLIQDLKNRVGKGNERSEQDSSEEKNPHGHEEHLDRNHALDIVVAGASLLFFTLFPLPFLFFLGTLVAQGNNWPQRLVVYRNLSKSKSNKVRRRKCVATF